MQYLAHYQSPLGDITLASDGAALTALWFDGQKYFADTLDSEHEEKALPIFVKADHWLDIYFSGCEPSFTPAYRIDGLTAFRRDVMEYMMQIPWGKTTTYGEIAARLAEKRGIARMSAQAVGGAVGWNPICLIIPCHRVIGADGSMTGYGGGLENKKALLKLEKILLSDEKTEKRV